MSLRFALQLQNAGAIIGKYRIVRVLGHGGYGAVYEAVNTQNSLCVALKETIDPTSITTFQDEFDILKGLRHPNLPDYYEMFVEQKSGYLVMEFVPGQNLQDVLSSQPGHPLLESQVMGYAIQVCDALSFLHSQTPPIIHRDIKPANIHITPAGLIKLVDFGLLKQGTGWTRTSLRGAGTPDYAPIEQYGTNQQHTDPRSDIYSLGATLYHLLTGYPPAIAKDRIAVTPDPLVPPQKLNPQLSAHMANAITTALNILQKDRFTDLETMKQTLMGVVGRKLSGSTVVTLSRPPLPVAFATAMLVITGIPVLYAFGAGAIGIVAGIFTWRGKQWGRRIGVTYLCLLILTIGILESVSFDVAHPSYYNPSGDWHYSIVGAILAIVLSASTFALLGLFRDDVLDFLYPQHAPHSNWAEFSVAVVAWAQILLGFWLIFPAVLGFGLLYRNRRALDANRLISRIGTILGALIFFPGVFLTAANAYGGGWAVPVFAHLTFLINSVAWYVLSRAEVDALF